MASEVTRRIIDPALPALPRQRRLRLQEAWSLSDFEMRSIVNADAVDLIEATIAAGATPDGARKWWMGELARHANATDTELGALGVTPAHVAELQQLVDAGKLTDKLARTVLDGVIAGEGGPAEVMAARGIAVVSDTGALTAAIDDAIAANAAVAEKIRGGNVGAAGVLIGAVMKATNNQADAKTVREMIIARLS